MNINRELNTRLISQSENDILHEKYNKEFGFYNNIVQGDLPAVRQTFCDPEDVNKYEDKQYGRLSTNKLQNLRYHFVVTVAIITRLCVDHGLDRELAYTLSDLYISRMDVLPSAQQILDLYNQMLIGFTEKMAQLQKKNIYSVHITKAIDYICSHRTGKLNANSIAQALDLNRSYLSALFKKETGISLSNYIRNEKLSAAANMLKYSDLSYTEIAEYFGFSSQSHFIQCFKTDYGCTPAEYRETNFRD